ncbi:solute carrier family 28 member 3-like isoform X2 [Mercenaria mercenaria]|uniref:solute carrier family 28 member 3-like isoform X2 n=1 Tax=Mercenaria mercenaria TaxID=6596 RepID=UPI00234F4C0E|nr:solute carrier family 28 member 3-like isoform X2 [Mercenaria mercenaria]
MSGNDIQLKSLKHFDNTNDTDEPPAYNQIEKTEKDGRQNPAYVSDNSSQESLDATPYNTNPDGGYPVGHNEIQITETIPNGLRHRHTNGEALALDDEVEQYEESSDDDDDYDTKIARGIGVTRKTIWTAYEDHKKEFWTCFWIVLACLYFAYFIYAMVKTFDVDDEGAMRLLIVTILGTLFVVGRLLWGRFMKDKEIRVFDSENPTAQKVRLVLYWCLVIGTILFFIAFIVVDVAVDRPQNLISALGMFVFVLLFFVASKNPAKVQFRPVFWGLALQFYFALLILRTEFGYRAFEWLGERVREFLAHTDAGSRFVFGNDYEHHFFAFKVLTVIVFFSAIISVLYYLGVMQFIIRYLARFLAFCLGTSPTESLNAAGNIFIGQSESPLMIRPFIKEMTKSELHAVCTGGFATIAGSVMAAYILMDVPPNHLLSASVMSAPAALAMAKLFYPETKKTKHRAEDVYKMPKGTETNIIEAASNGASVSIKLIANIAVNLIAFLAILQFLDQTLIWIGHRVDMYNPELTFTLICSYVFYPISWLLGTSLSDVRKVAGMIGSKTFLNEFVAYGELSVFINNTAKYNAYMSNETGTHNGTTFINDDIIINYTGEILVGGILTDRSIVIATYALCGFSNLASIGVMIGALGAMAPSRRRDITKIVIRAMISGNVACFMTACIAGLLYKGPI